MRNMDFNVKRARKGFKAHYLLNHTKTGHGSRHFGSISQSYKQSHNPNPHRAQKLLARRKTLGGYSSGKSIPQRPNFQNPGQNPG